NDPAHDPAGATPSKGSRKIWSEHFRYNGESIAKSENRDCVFAIVLEVSRYRRQFDAIDLEGALGIIQARADQPNCAERQFGQAAQEQICDRRARLARWSISRA